MTSIQLPHRHAYVVSFWFVLTSLVALGAWVGTLAAGVSDAWVGALGMAVVVVSPGMFSTRYFYRGVSAWNYVTRMLFRVLRMIALRLCFYITFPLFKRSGTSMEVFSPGFDVNNIHNSMWQVCADRGNQALSAAVSGEGWLADLVRHARVTGNWWLLSLVPLIFTLVLSGEEIQNAAPPTSTYTLY
jgi:hypothetical protein